MWIVSALRFFEIFLQIWIRINKKKFKLRSDIKKKKVVTDVKHDCLKV
jgi:hypothetical protein